MVLSFDRYSRDDVIGEVLLEMENLDLKDSEVCPLSLIRDIAPRSMKVNLTTFQQFDQVCVQLKDQGRGEMLVSVCHQPAAARLTVVILKARNLPKMDITGMSGETRDDKASDQTNSIYVKYIVDLFNFLPRRSICQDLSPSQRPENIEKENARQEENTESCLQ